MRGAVNTLIIDIVKNDRAYKTLQTMQIHKQFNIKIHINITYKYLHDNSKHSIIDTVYIMTFANAHTISQNTHLHTHTFAYTLIIYE